MDTSGVVFFLLGLATTAAAEPIVRLPFGSVAGNELQEVNEFLGIPFAPKPERFMPPSPWTARYAGGHLDAKAFTAMCPQIPDATVQNTTKVSEDCLHLNVYAPLRGNADKTPLPVMVWIHGGALETGSAMLTVYNGSMLAAKQKVVVVAINYRLNFFGFAVTRQEGGLALANNGFRDQREGLRWVRNHIAAFGGDPANVMIFGESAGGQSVATHVVSVGSGKLFDAAIAESGDILNVLNLSDAQQKTRDLATDLGCHRSSAREELACMQAARVEDILRLTNSTGPGAVIDMDILQAHPLTLIEQGNFNKVPFTLGSNKDEGNLFVYPPLAETAPATASDIRCAVKKTFGEKVGEKVLQLYPAVDEAGVDNRLIASQIFGAVTFHCDNRRVAQALSKAGVAPWLYSFNRQSSCSVFQGATHGAEISYVFGNPNASFLNNTACEVSSLDIALSNKVSGMWANFSRTHRMDERWTRFESPAREVNLKIDLSLVDTFDLEYSAHRSECDVLTRIGVFNDTGTPTVLPADNIGANLAECQEAAQDKHALSMTVVV